MPSSALIIDDDPTVRMLAELVLGSIGGMAVVTANSGAEGIERARAARPEVVLLDFVLPDMDGLAVLSALRSDPALAATCVIICSARHDAELEEAVHRAGACGVIPKPFEPATLIEQIRALRAARDADLGS